MASVARADLEALLRARKLDTTLTSARLFEPLDDEYVVSTGIEALDAHLLGGFARGQVSEIVGPRSSGRTAVLTSTMAAAAGRGDLLALVDTFDTFDPASAHAAGLDLSRLLWVRGDARAAYPSCSAGRFEYERQAQALDRAVKAFSLILQAGGFGLAVFDLADAPAAAIRRLPFTTWFRLHRPIEGSATAALVVADAPVTRSAGGVSVVLRNEAREASAPSPRPKVHGQQEACCRSSRLFPDLAVEARIARARGAAESCHFEVTWRA